MKKRAGASSETLIQRFRIYPEYRDSGVGWLGKIPSHWAVDRLKTTVSSCQNGLWGDEPDGLNDIVCVRVADFDRVRLRVHFSEPTFRSVDKGLVEGRLLKLGDLLLEKSGGGENQPVGAVVLYDRPEPAICSNFIARMIVAAGFDSRYLVYLHHAAYSVRLNTRSIKQSTGIQNLDSGAYLDESVPLPAVSEQCAIAVFLDRETAKIDTLVAKKENLIDLLQKKSKVIIAEAVTKGLDANVSTMASGVEWMGEIPAHWQCVSLSRVTRSRCDGPFGSSLKSEHYSATGVRVIRLQNIGWANFRDDDQVYIETEYARGLGDHSVGSGDLLIAGLGDTHHPVGRACVAPDRLGEAIVKADCFRFRLDLRKVNPQFAAYQLSVGAEAAAGSMATGATRSRMNLSSSASRKLAIPSITEQLAIVEKINSESERLDLLCLKITEGINRLKEFRTALISAAVTGKIDVREEST